MGISDFGRDGFDNADSSFQGLGNLFSTNPFGTIAGCLDNSMYNFNPNANADCDGNFQEHHFSMPRI